MGGLRPTASADVLANLRYVGIGSQATQKERSVG